MNRKFFNKKKYSKRCDSCFYGMPDPDGERVYCKKNGIMMASFCCKSYKYDALKRKPDKIRLLSQFNEDDFKL